MTRCSQASSQANTLLTPKIIPPKKSLKYVLQFSFWQHPLIPPVDSSAYTVSGIEKLPKPHLWTDSVGTLGFMIFFLIYLQGRWISVAAIEITFLRDHVCHRNTKISVKYFPFASICTYNVLITITYKIWEGTTTPDLVNEHHLWKYQTDTPKCFHVCVILTFHTSAPKSLKCSAQTWRNPGLRGL